MKEKLIEALHESSTNGMVRCNNYQCGKCCDAMLDIADNLRTDGIEQCAKLLDAEADRMEKSWNDHLASGKGGPATTFHTIPRSYAKMVRKLK